MTEYEKILKLTDSNLVQLGTEFKNHLHTHLQLGQSRWVCRYGTLSDGHEKITSAQRYYQAIKEIYFLSRNISQQKALAMLAQADLMDAEIGLGQITSPPDVLRLKAKLLQAQEKLISSLVTIEDQMRMVDEYNKVRLELKDEVERKYPEGIEQAEQDNWEAVYKYRIFKSQTPGLIRESTSNVPLPPEVKAQLGVECNRHDSMAPLAITNPSKLFIMLKDKKPLERMG